MAIDGPFVWGRNGQKLTPEQISRQREIEMELARGAIDTSPVGHWTQGLARVANAMAGSFRRGQLDQAEAENNAYSADLRSRMFGSSFPAAPASAGGIPAPAAQGQISTSSPAPVDISGSRQDFVNALLPAAIEEGKRTGIDPRIIVAQAAQETGWGKSAPGNNYFGIKSHGQAGGNSMMTTEVINGQPVRVRDSFRGYDSPEASVRGYGDFMLQNPRYQAMRSAQGMDAQLEALQASGYATDPNYSRSVGAIARGIQLPQEVAAAGPMTAYSDPMVSQSPAAAAIQTQSPQETASAPPLPPPVNVSTPPAPPEQQMVQELAQSAPPVANPNVGILPVLTGQPGQTNMRGAGQRDALLEALSSTRVDEGTRRIADVLIKQEFEKQQAAQQEQAWRARKAYEAELQQNDPSTQLDMRYKQAQLDALTGKKQKNWQRFNDTTLFDPETGETKAIGGGNPTGAFRFSGNSVEAQALNGLIDSKQLTPEQAQQLAAGKQITNPADGSIIFMTPQGIFGQPANGGPAQPISSPQGDGIDIFAGYPSSDRSAPGGQSAPSSGSSRSSLPPGAIQLTPGKAQMPTEATRNRAANVDQAFSTITGEFTSDDLLGVIFSRFCIGK